MDTTSFLGIILFVGILAVTPGPNNLMLAASAANFGFRRTVPHICGVMTGIAAMVLAIGLGMGALLKSFPFLDEVMRVFSTLFLLYLSWRIATAGRLAAQANARPLSFLAAASFQLINPKGVSFFASVTAAHVSADAPLLPQVIPLVFLLSIFTMISALIWSLFGTVIGRLLTNDRTLKIFNLVMAGLLVACIIPIAFA